MKMDNKNLIMWMKAAGIKDVRPSHAEVQDLCNGQLDRIDWYLKQLLEDDHGRT